MPRAVVTTKQKRFTVVGEFETGPVRLWLGELGGGEVRSEIEGCEGGFVVVAEVVEEDAVCARGGDGYDCC